MEMKEYNLGSLALCQDILDESWECRLTCGELWKTIESELQSSKIISITSVSSDADDIPAHRKVQTALPFLHPSNAPNRELLQEHLMVIPNGGEQEETRSV
jgi:hypothetical protein